MNIDTKYCVLLIGVCFLGWTGWAQPAIKTVSLSTSQGLTSNSITSIVQDGMGFIWIGTKRGLNKYDGHQFTEFKGQLLSNDISSLLVDKEGRLWIGTVGGGITLYNTASSQSTVFTANDTTNQQSISSNEIREFFEDSRGNVWIGTENGLNLYSGDSSFILIPIRQEQNTRSKMPITCITEDTRGNIIVGTFGEGLFMIPDGKQELYPISVDLQHASVRFVLSLYPISNDQVYVGTRDSGVLLFNTTTSHTIKLDDGRSNKVDRNPIIRTINRDRNGRIWIGTDGDGMYSLNPTSLQQSKREIYAESSPDSGVTGKAINVIFEDREGNLWVGTAWNGVTLIMNDVSGVVRYVSNPSTKFGAPVLSIHKNKNTLLLGTDGEGISLIDLTTGHVTKLRKFANKYIQSIYQDSKGLYWIGTYASGLLRYDGQSNSMSQFKNELNNPNSLSFNDVRGVIESDDSTHLWVATWGGGLNKFSKTTRLFQVYQSNEQDTFSISSNNITSIIKRSDGQLWMTTFGGSINVFDPVEERFHRFDDDIEGGNTFSSDNALTLFEDSRKQIWVGLWEKGINRIDPITRQVERFENVELIRDLSVTSVSEDNRGDLWFGTKAGIYHMDRSTGEFYAHPQLSGQYHINSSYTNEDGHFYFGGIEGVVHFKPEDIKALENAQHQRVILTDFKLFNESVRVDKNGVLGQHISLAKEITLKHDQNIITFEFTVPTYPTAPIHEFSIRLDGFDKSWRNIGRQRATTFTNLAPGYYTFKVRHRLGNGQWDPEATSIDVVIQKPFWATWWAYLVYFLLLFLFLYLFRKYTIMWEKMKSQLRLKEAIHSKDKELHAVKQRFFNNISHEIRTPVTLMISAAKRIAESIIVHNHQSVHFAALKKNGDYLLQLVNELLEFRKLEAGKLKLQVTEINLEEFSKEVFLSFQSQAKEHKVRYEFLVENEGQNVWIDSFQVEKVLFNLLQNSFKHTSSGGSIQMTVRQDDQYAYISIKDNGKGIETDQLENIFKRFYQVDDHSTSSQGFGIGLSIVKDIVEMHHGEVFVDSPPSEGCTFTIKLLLGNYHFTTEEMASTVLTETVGSAIDHHKEVSSSNEGEEVIPEDYCILIVEDNDDLRHYLEDLLKSQYKILTASNGDEGLKLAQRMIPDLVISDVIMPHKNGIEFTQELKECKDTSHIPVILLTARSGVIYKKEGFDIGADDYITKPFNESLLRARVKNLIKSRMLVWERLKVKSIAEPKELGLRSLDEEFLNKLMELVDANITKNNLSPEFLAEELAMSHSVIYKKLKQLTGQSIVEFIRDFKLKRGAELISKYKYSIEEACYKAGFSDRRYFSRSFKKKFGQTPSEYSKSQ